VARFSDLKFADLLKGTKARKTVEFPRQATVLDTEKVPGIEIDLVVLTGEQESEALKRARAFAVKNGVESPQLGEPIYDLGLMVETLALAVIDHDSPADAPARFFASADEILKHLDRERIVYLYTLQQTYQDALSPTLGHLTEEQVIETVIRFADEEDPYVPFEKLRPTILGSCFLSMARQLRGLLLTRSRPGNTSDTSTSSDTSPNG
jgi:hypothetical protein